MTKNSKKSKRDPCAYTIDFKKSRECVFSFEAPSTTQEAKDLYDKVVRLARDNKLDLDVLYNHIALTIYDEINDNIKEQDIPELISLLYQYGYDPSESIVKVLADAVEEAKA